MLIDPEATPMSAAELKKLRFDLPRLRHDSPKRCPCRIKDVEQYAAAESSDPSAKLRWARTVFVDDVSYWVWEAGQGEDLAYMYVEEYEGSVTLKSQAADGLPLEAFVVREYLHNQFGKSYE